MRLPPVRPAPCAECPWRRKAARGFLGPYTAEEWWMMAHGEEPIACHTSIPDSDESPDDVFLGWDEPGALQCAGAAIYRANVHKSPRDPAIAILPADLETVFGFGEFREHHEGSYA